MFDLFSDTESAKTIKVLRDVVDSLSARLRTGGLRSQHAASDVRALKQQISILESYWNQSSTASTTTSLRVAPNQ